MVAVPFHCLHHVILLFQLCLLHMVHGGAYYGQKQPPQQHQPIPQYDGFQQQQFLGNEMPLLPQYGNEFPQLPLQMGKQRLLTKGKGELFLNVLEHKPHVSLNDCWK